MAAEESENKKNKENANKRKKDKANESDEELADILEEDTKFNSTFEDEEGTDLRACTIKFSPATEFESYDYLWQVWTDINSPTPERAIKSKLFASISFVDTNAKKKPKLFVGRVLNRFLEDKDWPALCLVLDCLKLAVGSPTVLYERPRHLGQDVEEFPIYDTIAGPLDATFVGSSKWSIPKYPVVVKTFHIVYKLDRQN